MVIGKKHFSRILKRKIHIFGHFQTFLFSMIRGHNFRSLFNDMVGEKIDKMDKEETNRVVEEVPMSEVKDFSFFISEMAKYDGKLDSDTVQEASEPVKIFF